MHAKKIMLAEDDSDDQKLFCEFLSHRTDIVVLPIAENGVDLLDALANAAEDGLPHVIILDQNMPKSNGLQTVAALKNLERYSGIPIVIYSTYTDEQLIKKGTQAGASLVVSKPVSKKGYDEMMDLILKLTA
jgi:CheY-like chemotaxis protein